MGTPDVRKALLVDGKLCWDPTNLANAYPHGGVGLGTKRNASHRIGAAYHVIRAEEWAGAAVDAIYPAEEHTLAVILSAWDSDAIDALFLDTATGATTGRRIIQHRVSTDNKRAGTVASTLAGILYFSPTAKQHPGVLLHNAICLRLDQGETAYHLAEEWGQPLLFIGTPDATGRVVQVGLREDLTL